MRYMWLFDFHIFYSSAQTLLAGKVGFSEAPFTLTVLFVPFALLPEKIAYVLYLLINIFIILKICGKRSIFAFLSFPVFYLLYVGQVDLMVGYGVLLGSPWLIPLAFAKPQIGFVVLPWVIRRFSRRDFLIAGFSSIVFLAVCFILRPTWLNGWMTTQPGMANYSRRASNLYFLISNLDRRAVVTMIGASLSFLLSFLVPQRKISWIFLHLFAPLTNIYSASILINWIGPLEMILSWIAIILVKGDLFNGAPLFLIGLSILIRYIIRHGLRERHVWAYGGRTAVEQI